MPIFASALPFPVSLPQNGFWVTPPTLNPSWCIISRCKHLTSAFSSSVVIPEHLHFKKYYFIINYSPFISPLYWSHGIILRIVFKCVGSNIIYGSHLGWGRGHSDALHQGMQSQMPLGTMQAYVRWPVNDIVSGSLHDPLKGIHVYILLKGPG